MKIYFVNFHCNTASPADLKLSCELKIQEGDICIRNLGNALNALFVTNPQFEWEKLPLISFSLNSLSIDWGNSLLYSFDGIDERHGNIVRLKQLSRCFSDKIFNNFLSEVIAILNYEKDLIDLAVLKTIIESRKNTPNKSPHHFPTTTAPQYSQKNVSFFSCLSCELQNEVIQRLKMDTPKRVLHHIRTVYPKDFRIAFKEFNEENPNGNIYAGLP